MMLRIKPLLATLLMLFAACPAAAQYKAERFSFEAHDRTYVGVIDLPEAQEVHGLILLIHGHGRTNVLDGDDFKTTRRHFNALGYTTALYDRAGNGESEGVYNNNQSVQSSAKEVTAALDALRSHEVPGVDHLGLWGVSRGGWIAPLAMKADGDVDFWISVSGPSQFETFDYMLKRNLILRGEDDAYASKIARQWVRAHRMHHDPDASYADYRASTSALYAEPWYTSSFGTLPSKAEFEEIQRSGTSSDIIFDEASGREVVTPALPRILSDLDVPVLAIFGDLDSQVNWREARQLYEEKMGDNLTVKVLPDCNHSMRTARTGAFREDLSADGLGERCPGFFESMESWLKAREN